MNRRKISSQLQTVTIVAIVWSVAFLLNEALFNAFKLTQLANWIFVPAAVRLLAILLFGRTGALGLVVGAYIVLQTISDAPWPYDLVLALTSGAAPLLALALCRRFLVIPPDLAGLRPLDIIILSIASAGCNALFLTVFQYVTAAELQILHHFRIIFVGDMVGTALVMFLLSAILTFALPKRI